MIMVTNGTLERRQEAQDLALVLLGPWAGLIYAAVLWMDGHLRRKNGRSEPTARRPPLSAGSVMERGPGTPRHAPSCSIRMLSLWLCGVVGLGVECARLRPSPIETCGHAYHCLPGRLRKGRKRTEQEQTSNFISFSTTQSLLCFFHF